MLSASLCALLFGTLLLLWAGYSNGYAMGPLEPWHAPEHTASLRGRRRFYVASMVLALVGVLLLVTMISLFRVAEVDAGWLPLAAGGSAAYAVLGIGMFAYNLQRPRR